jgi:hypothetical protein
MAGRDITEGRGSNVPDVGYAVAFDVGIVSSTAVWENTQESYDTAIGGLPFFFAINNDRPYIRQTAPFRKEQFDNGSEPGEQSLTGWWIRSQSSFHNGSGINFYDPSAGESVLFRFNDSKGVDVWTKGEVTLLNDTTKAYTSATTTSVPIIVGANDGTNDILLVADDVALKKITMSDDTPAVTSYTLVAAHTNQVFVSIVTDGTRYFAADEVAIHVGNIGGTTNDDTTYATGTSSVTLGYVKQRLIAGVGRSLYELNPNATPVGNHATTALPTATFTHPNSSWVWTSIAEGPVAIYSAGKLRNISSIFMTTLSNTTTTGLGFPALLTPRVIADFPEGEVVNDIKTYLGAYMVICTSKGVRVATLLEDGGINYGPIIREGNFNRVVFRDRFAYVSGIQDGDAGLLRIDLSAEIEPLRFGFAWDVYASGVTSPALSLAFLGSTDRIAFAVQGEGVWIESALEKVPSGFLKTGNIRYGTLEPKNFKRLLGRGEFNFGSMTMLSVDKNNTEYDLISYGPTVPAVEVTTSNPPTAQEFIAYKFILFRDADSPNLGPTFKGYQAKSTIATPRQRVLRFPVFCFDVETDRYNVQTGYEGRAFERILALEAVEENGDVLTWQDLTTGESRQVVIEQISFTRETPPDKRFDGFGGVITMTIRTV